LCIGQIRRDWPGAYAEKVFERYASQGGRVAGVLEGAGSKAAPKGGQSPDFSIVNRVQGSTIIDQNLRFSDAEIVAEMNRSSLGRTVADAANNNTISLDFRPTYPTPGVLGYRLPGTTTGVIFVENNAVYSAPGVVDRAASLRAVGDTAVHEGLHALGIGGSWDAELWVRRLSFEHSWGRVPTAAEIAQMEADMQAVGAYASLPHNVGSTITIDGRTIVF
jgi:hypothetical protein